MAVVIPTHNRKQSLWRALDSLQRQELGWDCLQVMVVDDGSTDGTGDLNWSAFPFRVQYCYQQNSGATAARNAGASCCSSAIYAFMDDDIVVAPQALRCLVGVVCSSNSRIGLATLVSAFESPTPFAALYGHGAIFPADIDGAKGLEDRQPTPTADAEQVHFTKCKTGLLAIKAEDFSVLGGFHDPTGGWPNWDDVDFGYRAHLQGFQFYRSKRALAYHHDSSLRSLEAACHRHHQAARAAARLLRRYPDLAPTLTTYHDKGPLSLGADSPSLATRKVLRSLASCQAIVVVMKQLSSILAARRPASPLLPELYRWILSAYICRGYRLGLREIGGSTP